MSLIGATVFVGIATMVLAAGTLVSVYLTTLTVRRQSQETLIIQQEVQIQQAAVERQAELLRVHSGQLKLQSQQFEDQRQANARHGEVLELQASEIRASLEQRQRDAAEHRRKQAARVTAWLARQEDAAPPSWGACVRNASDEPVFDVRVFFHHMREKDGGGYHAVSQGSPPPRETIGVLPPGEDRFVAIPENVRAMFGTITIDDTSSASSVEFTDAAGNRWERDPRGALVPGSLFLDRKPGHPLAGLPARSRRPFSTTDPPRYGRMTPMAASPSDDPDRSCDLARIRELARPHRTHGALIQQVLPHMTPDDFNETIAILERLGDPDESAHA